MGHFSVDYKVFPHTDASPDGIVNCKYCGEGGEIALWYEEELVIACNCF